MSFYTYMMRNYRGTNTPEGSLAHDMELDRDSFQKNGTGKFEGRHKLIREHLERNDACEECLEIFERCWEEYVRCEKSRMRKSLCRR